MNDGRISPNQRIQDLSEVDAQVEAETHYAPAQTTLRRPTTSNRLDFPARIGTLRLMVNPESSPALTDSELSNVSPKSPNVTDAGNAGWSWFAFFFLAALIAAFKPDIFL